MNTVQPLTDAECWALLGRHELGRVAFTEHAMPTIVPVRYTFVGDRFVLMCRTQGLAERLDGQIVALEVDEIDPTLHGAAVVVTGTASRRYVPGRTPQTDEPHAVDGCTAVRLTAGHVRGLRLQDVA